MSYHIDLKDDKIVEGAKKMFTPEGYQLPDVYGFPVKLKDIVAFSSKTSEGLTLAEVVDVLWRETEEDGRCYTVQLRTKAGRDVWRNSKDVAIVLPYDNEEEEI